MCLRRSTHRQHKCTSAAAADVATGARYLRAPAAIDIIHGRVVTVVYTHCCLLRMLPCFMTTTPSSAFVANRSFFKSARDESPTISECNDTRRRSQLTPAAPIIESGGDDDNCRRRHHRRCLSVRSDVNSRLGAKAHFARSPPRNTAHNLSSDEMDRACPNAHRQ